MRPAKRELSTRAVREVGESRFRRPIGGEPFVVTVGLRVALEDLTAEAKCNVPKLIGYLPVVVIVSGPEAGGALQPGCPPQLGRRFVREHAGATAIHRQHADDPAVRERVRAAGHTETSQDTGSAHSLVMAAVRHPTTRSPIYSSSSRIHPPAPSQ